MEYQEHPSARHVDQGNRIDLQKAQEVARFYDSEMMARTKGPQLEAMDPAKLAEALEDGAEVMTIEVPVSPESAETIDWPLLTPITYHEGYDPAYFEKHYKNKQVFYFEMPPEHAVDDILNNQAVVAQLAQQLTQKEAAIVYDYRVGDELAESSVDFLETILAHQDKKIADTTPPVNSWGVDFGHPEGEYFEGIVRLEAPPEEPAESVADYIYSQVVSEEGTLELPTNGAAYLVAEHLEDETLRQELWEMYIDQFSELGEDHPIYTNSPQEEFFARLQDHEGLITVYMEDGKPVGLLDFVNTPEKCPWLNPDYYESKYGDRDVWLGFVPGIVVAKDKAQLGLGYAQELMRKAAEAVQAAGKDLVIAFGCTNTSRTYIPKTIQRFVEGDPMTGKPGLEGMSMELDEKGHGFRSTAVYRHHVLEVADR